MKFAEDLRKRFSDNLREARENLDVARVQQAEQYNQGRRDLQFEVGDFVLRRTHPLSDAARGFAASLANRWEGPFRVREKCSPLTYKLVHCETSEETGPVHVTDLKRFFQAEDEDSSQDRNDTDGSPVPETPLSPPGRRYNLRRR